MSEDEALLDSLDLSKGIDLRISVERGDPGYYLALAVAYSIQERFQLKKLKVRRSDVWFDKLEASTMSEDSSFLKMNHLEIEEYHDDLIYPLYEKLEGTKLRSMEALNFWIRAWAPGSDTLMKIHHLALSGEVLASLVERGGQILKALKM